MLATLTKWLIQLVAIASVASTGIVYWGATTWRGKLGIALSGLLIYLSLAIWSVWLDRRPTKFIDWL
ncbi:MAG: hypothetical protein EOO88_39845 [Pedobacter sp.]|nr:MAG: hypothetical protein EOO88_39845 [Pedobacter sp.]